MISGSYVSTFAEASHALAAGVHLSSDYPFKAPRIKSADAKSVTLISDSGDQEVTLPIERSRSGREVAYIEQRSFFERASGHPATRFPCYAFKDRNTSVPPSAPGSSS
jgi:hypothetical protein